MQPFDTDKHLCILMAISCIALSLCVGCEPGGGEDWSEEEIRNLVTTQVGSVDVSVGDNSTIRSIDTIDSPVRVQGGYNTTVGPINTAPAPQEEE
jgi:hypothetical protein